MSTEATESAVSTPHRAIALLSGGLDSMLAAKVIMEQGVHVEGITFFTGFCVDALRHVTGLRDTQRPNRHDALWVAEQLGIRHHVVDVVEDYKAIVINPRHGYGANLNPCLDCKVFMVRRAVQWMHAHAFDFIITGEVIGQRPMSQRKHTMPIVSAESGANDRLLRPLSAQLLPETLPEREGWVDRTALHAFHGRSRKPQINLAKRLGLEHFSQPAGGCCVLTDAAYSRKLGDLWQHRGERDYDFDDVMLLNAGRHLRPRPHFKLIVARDEAENNYLEGYRRRFLHLRTTSHNGPIVLIDGGPVDADDLQLAARITARFSQGRDAAVATVAIAEPGQPEREVTVAPLVSTEVSPEWYV